MEVFFYYFLIFFIYSVLGWIVESIYVTFTIKKMVNRGFLIGPYCPIYGCGSLIMILYLTQYQDNIITVFILGMVICAILEYLTSYIMEIIFKTRWWDYSNQKFNLNGRICGKNALLFGIGGVFIIYITQPLISKCLEMMPNHVRLVISIIFFVIFLADSIISFNIIHRFKKNVTNMELRKDSTQEISKMVKEVIQNSHHIFQNRLINAFPNIDIKNLVKFKNDITEEFKERFKK